MDFNIGQGKKPQNSVPVKPGMRLNSGFQAPPKNDVFDISKVQIGNSIFNQQKNQPNQQQATNQSATLQNQAPKLNFNLPSSTQNQPRPLSPPKFDFASSFKNAAPQPPVLSSQQNSITGATQNNPQQQPPKFDFTKQNQNSVRPPVFGQQASTNPNLGNSQGISQGPPKFDFNKQNQNPVRPPAFGQQSSINPIAGNPQGNTQGPPKFDFNKQNQSPVRPPAFGQQASTVPKFDFTKQNQNNPVRPPLQQNAFNSGAFKPIQKPPEPQKNNVDFNKYLKPDNEEDNQMNDNKQKSNEGLDYLDLKKSPSFSSSQSFNFVGSQQQNKAFSAMTKIEQDKSSDIMENEQSFSQKQLEEQENEQDQSTPKKNQEQEIVAPVKKNLGLGGNNFQFNGQNKFSLKPQDQKIEENKVEENQKSPPKPPPRDLLAEIKSFNAKIQQKSVLNGKEILEAQDSIMSYLEQKPEFIFKKYINTRFYLKLVSQKQKQENINYENKEFEEISFRLKLMIQELLNEGIPDIDFTFPVHTYIQDVNQMTLKDFQDLLPEVEYL